MSGSPHPFDRATAIEALEEGRWRAETSDAYWNMVGPFGGVIAALLFRAAHGHPERQGEPLALTVNFCAPVRKGEMWLSARPARTNRSTQHWLIELRQDDDVVATATAMFGSRPETFALRPLAAPNTPPASDLPRFPAVGTGWTERYDLRFAEGAPGPHGDGSPRSLLWIADDPPRPLDFAGLVAMCDVFFGRIIHVRQRMVPFGTVTLTTYFHATHADLEAEGDAPVLGRADARIFERGYHDQTAELWSSDSKLLATSHQLVYYRDPA